MNTLPPAIAREVAAFDPELPTKRTLLQIDDLTTRLAALDAARRRLVERRAALRQTAQATCPHQHTRLESDDDFHRPRWTRECELCDATLPRNWTPRD